MTWKDRLIMKAMGNKLIIKIFSIPIVLKTMMLLTKGILWVMGKLKRKPAQAA